MYLGNSSAHKSIPQETLDKQICESLEPKTYTNYHQGCVQIKRKDTVLDKGVAQVVEGLPIQAQGPELKLKYHENNFQLK
jgi:hypothetical protein